MVSFFSPHINQCKLLCTFLEVEKKNITCKIIAQSKALFILLFLYHGNKKYIYIYGGKKLRVLYLTD